MNDDKTTQAPEPWWKFGHVWLVIAGPCVVVVAGFITAFIAMSSPDPVL
ncbi:MAG: nitrogen fixation protein FixH, partial [Ramlibacter sp.]|nr:nitrogen fixation protein FixH [Ramlibacter sp.]